MITVTTHKIKSFTQKSYNKFIEALHLHQLSCSCGVLGHFIKHAYYKRTIKTPDGPVFIRVLRVICKCCGKTHAIFPKVIVPYSQIPLTEHLSIIKMYHSNSSYEQFMIANEYIDESNIKYIIRQYLRHWKERITAFRLPLNDETSLVINCLKLFSRQFMQIKCVPNLLIA